MYILRPKTSFQMQVCPLHAGHPGGCTRRALHKTTEIFVCTLKQLKTAIPAGWCPWVVAAP